MSWLGKHLSPEKVLLSHINGNKDGYDILHKLFKGPLPYLVATYFDIKVIINTIIFKDGILLADFLGKARYVQTSINISDLLIRKPL